MSYGALGTMQPTDKASSHMMPLTSIVAPQHKSEPPGAAAQPEPPHWPQEAAQHLLPLRMPTEQ